MKPAPAQRPPAGRTPGTRSSLSTQLTLLVAAIVAVLLGAMLIAGNRFWREILRGEIDARLSAVAESRQDMVQANIAKWRQLATLMAINGTYRALLDELQRGEAATANRKFSQGSLDGFVKRGVLVSAMIADSSGRVEIASNVAIPSGSLADDPDFQRGQSGLHVGQPRRVGDHFEVVLGAPLEDFGTPRTTIGVLMLTVLATPLAEAMLDYTGLGETGEALLGVREEGHIRFLFPLRHGDGTLTLPVANAPAMNAAIDGRQQLTHDRDYRGQPVLAAVRPIRHSGWGLVVKMDQAEAYAPIDRALRYGLGLGATIALLGLVAAWLLARGFTRPILRLAEAAEGVAGGRLDVAVLVTSKSEAGELTARFNEMTAALRTHAAEREAAAKALDAERSRLRTLIDVLPVSIYVKDTASRFLVANEECARALGAANSAELIGKTDADFFPAAIAATFLADEQRVMAGEPVLNVEEVSAYPDGSARTEMTTKVPLRDGTGVVVGVVGVSRDITERKRAEDAVRASEALLRSITDHTEDIIFVKDRESRTLFMNPAGLRLTALPREKLIGHRDTEFIRDPEEAAHFLADDLKVMESRETLTVEEELTAGTGEKRVLLTTKAPRFDGAGTVIGLVGIAHDITARKQAEEEIRRLNAGLEERVKERTAQLEASNKELEAFSYSVSHDLRAPLRAVNGFIRMLQNSHGDKLDAEGRRLIGVVLSEGKRMGRLIDDLLAFSRMGRQQVEHTSIDMAALARAEFESLTRVAPDSAPRLALKPLPPAHGDPAMLRQVLANLLANSIKFTRKQPGPVIEISGACEDGMVTYSVKDNGAGFDDKYAHKLFGVFQRLHTESEFEGTGVGLALVQRIVDRHGGKVWAEGKPGAGATFYFSLPNPKKPNP